MRTCGVTILFMPITHHLRFTPRLMSPPRRPCPTTKVSVSVLVAVLALGAASCTSSPATEDPGHPSASSTTDAAVATESADFPVTIDSSVGSATVTEQPRRVVTLGWGSSDAAAALGVPPVGIQEISDDTGNYRAVFPWNRGAFAETPELLDPGEVPYEAIAALHPDVILAVNSGITSGEHARLTEIAPTVGYPGRSWQTGWEDLTRIVGTALGRSDAAESLITDTDRALSETARNHPEFRGRTVAFAVNTDGTRLREIPVTDSRYAVLRRLGFAASPTTPGSAASFSVARSLETLPDIDADVLVVWHLSDQARQTLEDQPTFAAIPAVASGGYLPVTDPLLGLAVSTVTATSVPWALDHGYVDGLADATEGGPVPGPRD